MKFEHKRIDIRRIERIFVARSNGLESLSTRDEEKKGIDAKRSDQAGRSIHAKKKM